MSDKIENNCNYIEGYSKGKNWSRDYIPGGPFVCSEKTKKAHEYWMKGFYDGLEVNCNKDTLEIKSLLSNLK